MSTSATQETASAFVTNGFDGHATITLYHKNSSYGTQCGVWFANPGQQVGPLEVLFPVGGGSGLVLDYWAIEVAVQDGSSPGIYRNGGWVSSTPWKECQLQKADVGQSLPLSVDTATFSIDLPSGGCTASMSRASDYVAVDHVFVLMLENHSFDNMLAFSGIPGIQVATTANSNTFDGTTYSVSTPAPASMPTDPGHNFCNVLTQLCGEGTTTQPWTPYPSTITNSGFVADYQTQTPNELNNIMACLDTPSQITVLPQLAAEFAVCDQWFSSLPGPTWPNRFFLHGASSGGWSNSPGGTQEVIWMSPLLGFKYPSGNSIFDTLGAAGWQWRIYVDESGPAIGGIPMVAALKGVTYGLDCHPFANFADDLQNPYPYAYTFIEPNYGDVSSTYEGGSSQHPLDSPTGGENLIKALYEAVRSSPFWSRSVLIVTYDEHGGFYDSVAPGRATPPGDGSPNDSSINSAGFMFDHYGVRVPAVIVSPLIPQATVDHTLYDHTSVLATLESLFGLTALTNRDKGANNLLHLLSLTTPRTDCPTTLTAPPPPELAARALVAPDIDRQPLPASGDVHAPLQVALKIDLELSGADSVAQTAARARFKAVVTRGDAAAYATDVMTRARAARANAAQSGQGGVSARS
jgi:phospholipase C